MRPTGAVTKWQESMDIKVAEALSLLMMRINANLDDSIALMLDNGSVEEVAWYRQEAGKIMGALMLEIEERLWSEHPSLRPKELGGSYVVPTSSFEPRFYQVRRVRDA
jgi:hypothetical protein